MSFTNASSDLQSFVEVVPESAKMGQLSKSSLLTQRKRIRLTPQTGSSSGPSQQIQFLLSDGSGILDLRSVVINFTMKTLGSGSVAPDDCGAVFSTAQALLNGSLLESIQNAGKVSNVEMTMGGSKTYYETAGSFQGAELLAPDLINDTTAGQYGVVANNLASIDARYKRASAPMWNNTAGTQRSIPLGLLMGLGRCATLLPINLLGELSLIFQTGSNPDVLFQTGTTGDASYTLSGISLEADVVVPDGRYMQLLQKVASEDGGMTIAYESVVVATGGVITASTSALQESSIITSRATNHLTKSAIVFIPQALTSSYFYPSQSCFSHAGLFGFQTRIGSQVFPQISAQGDASIFNTSLCAYGSAMQENGSATNRVLWANSTNTSAGGTLSASYEDAVSVPAGGSRFAYGDRCVPSYGYRIVKGGAEPLDVDGVSLAGASGSQIIHTIVSAPQTNYTPYVLLTALRFIKASGGAVSVVGA